MDIYSIEERVEEIKGFVQDNNLNDATVRLIDICKDFEPSESDLNDAILFRKDFTKLVPEIRVYGYNEKNRAWELTLSRGVLEHADQIKSKILNRQEETKELVGKQDVNEGSGTEQNALEVQSDTDPVKQFVQTGKKPAILSKNLEDYVVCEGRGVAYKYNNKGDFGLGPLSFQLREREITSLVGENGNGKTTLIRLIAGMRNPLLGSIRYPQLSEDDLNWYKIKSQIAYIPQEIPAWEGSLRHLLSFSASAKGVRESNLEKELDYIITRLGLEQYLDKDWGELSGGYKTRFELARMLVWNPKLLVLDEPLSNLDINAQIIFLKDLRSLADSLVHPISVVISSQHLHEVEAISDKVMFLEDGQIKFYDKLSEMGKNREMNAFEVKCKIGEKEVTRDQLYTILKGLDINYIDDINICIVIYTSTKVTANEVVNSIENYNDCKLEYFRDISLSTKLLFRKKY